MRAAKICGGAKTRIRVPKIEPSANSRSRHAGAVNFPDSTASPFAFSEYLTWIKAKTASSPI
jgi:hypothetical protein